MAAKKMGMSAKSDAKQDMRMMKGMSSSQKKMFKAADKKMDIKKPSAKADLKMDKALRKKIMGKKGK